MNELSIASALLRCQELLPSLDLDINELDEQNLTLRPVGIHQWHEVILEALTLVVVLQGETFNLPDVEPYTDMYDMLDDLECLLLSLRVFYDCTLKTCRIEPR